MIDNCVMCHCQLFEHKPNCSCMCHPFIKTLVKMNHGDLEKTRRDLENDVNNSNPFDLSGIGISAGGEQLKEFLEHLIGPGKEVKVGFAIEGSDTSKMIADQLIDYEVQLGIQKGVLPNGFVLDKASKVELMRVIDLSEPKERVPVCISYLQGYNKGYKLGRWQEKHK